MPRKVTVEFLVEQGVPRAKAEQIVREHEKPQPRVVFWQFKATEKQAKEVARAFPDLEFSKRHPKRAPKKTPKETAPAKPPS